MKAETKYRISLMLNIILTICLFVAVANVDRYNRHNQYHRDRMLDNEFEERFTMLYPDSSLQYFKKKWGDELKENIDYSHYFVGRGTILNEPFFVKNKYNADLSSISHLELTFDEKGNLVKHRLIIGP